MLIVYTLCNIVRLDIEYRKLHIRFLKIRTIKKYIINIHLSPIRYGTSVANFR